MADSVVFYVLVAGAIEHVKIDPRLNLAALLMDMKSPRYQPSPRLKRMEYRQCNFYLLKDPLKIDDENFPDIEPIIASLQDKTKCTQLTHTKHLKNIAKEFHHEHLYLVIEDTSNKAAQAVARLSQNHADLYQCLKVTVGVAKRWTRDYAESNGGIFVNNRTKPPEMKELETRLKDKRFFNGDTEDEDLCTARTARTKFAIQFESSYTDTSRKGRKIVKDSREFVAFYTLLRCYLPDATYYQTAPSSSLKALALKVNFIIPAFFQGRQTNDDLEYHEEMPWKFPLFISCPAMSNLPRKYVPCSNFSVWFTLLGLPLIIGEIVLDPKEEDRYRMLLQGITLARLVFHLRKPATARPFIVAIYLTKALIAERYIMMQTESETANKVYILQKDFDLTKEADVIAFQREMYNLASELTSVFEALDSSKGGMLSAIQKEASGMMSLHSSGAWNEQTPAPTLHSTTEEQYYSGHENEDDLGVFGGDDVRYVVKRMGYEVAYVAFGHPNMAPILRLSDGEMVGCLKFVKDGGKAKEVEILQYLVGLDVESNHTVRPMRIWAITGGWIIAMPAAGNRLTQLIDLDTHLWSLMKQLFEAVKFMHDHNVAHLDLKPSNILIPSEYGRLTIIDFGVSVRLRNAAQLLQGRAGTEGYIAPEVDGRTKFSPIRADLWSTGKIVQELCMLCRPSRSRGDLLALSKQLLDDDPDKRPMMSEALQWMLNHDVITAANSVPTI